MTIIIIMWRWCDHIIDNVDNNDERTNERLWSEDNWMVSGQGEVHTVTGLGSKILLINFLALEENHGGQVKSALNICSHRNPKFSFLNWSNEVKIHKYIRVGQCWFHSV